MIRRLLLPLNRLQRKVVNTILVMVVVPMLVAGMLASEWVSSNFEARLQSWIEDASPAGETWLRAYQNDAIMLGRVLADDPDFVAGLDRGAHMGTMKQPVARIAKELNVSIMQVYTAQQILLYTSMPIRLNALWELGQTQAVMKVVQKKKDLLAAVGITPVPRQGKPRYYLVLGGLLNNDFISELNQLTGLKSRLYYREGARFFDVFTQPGQVTELKELSKESMRRMVKEKKTYYSQHAEGNHFRGVYTPVVDSAGRVEAILFSGLERRGFEELLTNRLLLFASITLLGVAISVAVGVFLSRLVVRPVELLRNGVMQLSAQNFNAAVPVISDDEVGDLAKAFNAMAVRLRDARDAQQQNFQKDKLVALGELSAALAHEIRNPIGVINASAALLDKPGQTPEKQAELTRMIREESARVSHLVQDFLQISRYRKPKFALIDPAVPMERALATALAGRDNVRVEKSLQHDGAHIQADPGLLQQAWGNIFTNAIQAMGAKGGALRVETHLEHGMISLSVEDSGPGIPPDIMPRLFEPFFTTKDEGTGLGLSIANTLTDANGGRLEVQTPEHGGARFAMWFPVQEERAES
jgi:signal transduction histidine kinase